MANGNSAARKIAAPSHSPFRFLIPCCPCSSFGDGARAAPARGYTAIEVLIAMTVMSIGAAAVISMQRASIQGNLDARKEDVANSIARTWIERLQRDAMQWTKPGPSDRVNTNLANALLLNAGLNTNPGVWFIPNQYIGLTPPLSPAFDILGRDVPQTSLGTELFCVGVRMTWLAQPNPAAGIGGLIRADVRVLWPRGISNSPGIGGVCGAANAGTPPPDPLVYHAIYLTTALQGNPQ